MRIELLSDIENVSQTGDAAAQWQRLYETECPWATVFQSPAYVSLWYECYAAKFRPVFLRAWDENNALAGVLPLAEDKETGELVHAGAHQAGYHVWLARPADGDAFILAALERLRADFARATLQLTYLPPDTPIDWLTADPFWKKQHIALRTSLPLIETQKPGAYQVALKRLRLRKYLNILERFGNIEFTRLHGVEALEECFDEIITLANFRLGARHYYDELPQDPYKKQFYLEQMKRGLLHVTVTRVRGEMAGVEICIFNRGAMRGSILTHSPFFAQGSPGRVHILYLWQLLAAEGIPILDMSPFGAYKDRIATRQDEVTKLTLFLSASVGRRQMTRRAIRETVKKGLRAAHQDPEQLREKAATWRHKLGALRVANVPATLAGQIRKRVHYDCEMRVYKFDLAAARQLTPSNLIRRNKLEDILQYKPAAGWQPRVSEFLHHASNGFEKGHHCYTYAEDGQLLHWGWLAPNQASSTFEEVGQTIYLPPKSSVMSSFHTQPQAQGRGLYRQALTQILHDAAHTPGVEHLFIFVHADNGPSRHVIEKIGFEDQFSFFQKVRWGRVERWTDAPAEFTAPPSPP